MKPLVSMREALTDDALLGNALPGESWAAWRALLIALFGEELTDAERDVWRELTQREREPGELVEEAALIVGRRGGKSKAISTAATYIAGLCDYSNVLSPGERGWLPVMSQTQKQAGIVFSYACALFEASPVLSSLIENRTADSLSLSNSVDLEIRPASFRGVRGPTAVAAVGDEVAFWAIEGSANPDVEILNALRPALATTGGPLLMISSPYARRGELWNTYRQHYGPDGDRKIVVVQAPSRALNPTLPEKVVKRALERDPHAAAAEYLAQFRTDVEQLLTVEAIESCVDKGIHERPRIITEQYTAFCDPSGGSADSMTLCIAHREGDKAVVDCLRERKPPFSPQTVVKEFAETLREYGLRKVTGDRFGGAWVREAFQKERIEYWPAAKPKSDLYISLVAVVNSGRLSLLDNERLSAQLVGLERRTARGGRDSIDHAPGAHDDIANAVAGVVDILVARARQSMLTGTGRAIVIEPGTPITPYNFH